MAISSSVAKGKERNSPILRSSTVKASRNARAISFGVPLTPAGSAIPDGQCQRVRSIDLLFYITRPSDRQRSPSVWTVRCRHTSPVSANYGFNKSGRRPIANLAQPLLETWSWTERTLDSIIAPPALSPPSMRERVDCSMQGGPPLLPSAAFRFTFLSLN
jgi:hypothetical protein